MKYVVALVFCISILANAHSQEIHKIWSGTSVPYHFMMPPCITIYPADKAQNTKVAVIVCPGGSYHHLGMNHEGYDVARWFQSKGINAFVLRYRVGFWGFHHPAMIEDLQRSIQFVKENAGRWGIDTSKVGLVGFSAGGHLVASGGIFFTENYLQPLGITTKVSLRPSFVVPVYPVISMQDSIAHKRSRNNLLGKKCTQAQKDKMSLEMQVRKDGPPMMVVVQKDDPVVDWRNGFYFYQSLIKLSPSSKLILSDKGGHGFGINPEKGGEAARWNEKCLVWMKEIGILTNDIK